jgi:hypothetical protein
MALAVPMATMKSTFLRVEEKVVLGANEELGFVASLMIDSVLNSASYYIHHS